MQSERLQAISNIFSGVAVAVVGASAGFAVTFLVKHHAPGLWLLWFGSGAAIAFALACWRPGLWLLAACATVSVVVGQTVLALPSVAPTAAALSLAFVLIWCVLTFLGAHAGRAVGDRSRT